MGSCCYWSFVRNAFLVCIVLTGNEISRGIELEPKNKVDFILLVDRSPPAIPGWTPSSELLKPVAETKTVHWWTRAMVKNLLDLAHAKGADARVAVFTLDRKTYTLTNEGEFYSAAHKKLPSTYEYGVEGLSSAAVYVYPFNAIDFNRIKENVSNAIAASKPANRMGVTDILLWHVPYDGQDPAHIDLWRKAHYPTVDVMVALESYWGGKDIYGLFLIRVYVSHPLVRSAYLFGTMVSGSVSVFTPAQPLVSDTWNIFTSCRASVTTTVPCHFNEIGACVLENTYIPQGRNATLLKYCRNGTEEMHCLYGQWKCKQLCIDASEHGPCSVTCDDGTKTLRPRNSTDELVKYCEPMNVTCFGPPCFLPVETTRRTSKTRMINRSKTRKCCTTTMSQDGASMAPWKVTAIVMSTTIVLAVAAAITVWRVGQQKKMSLMNQIKQMQVDAKRRATRVDHGPSAKGGSNGKLAQASALTSK